VNVPLYYGRKWKVWIDNDIVSRRIRCGICNTEKRGEEGEKENGHHRTVHREEEVLQYEGASSWVE